MIRSDEKSQFEAREYVLKKIMIRPKTTIWSPVLLLVVSIVIGAGVAFFLLFIIESCFEVDINNFYLIVTISGIVTALLVARRILILCIKCYQHYASENIRRSCVCMPTCSEYAIIVLQKYNLIKAIKLIYIRLTKTCTGSYKIDIPD